MRLKPWHEVREILFVMFIIIFVFYGASFGVGVLESAEIPHPPFQYMTSKEFEDPVTRNAAVERYLKECDHPCAINNIGKLIFPTWSLGCLVGKKVGKVIVGTANFFSKPVSL